MNVGMLWLDADKGRSFDEKVQRAAEYYTEKYGRFPELCFVNMAALPDERKIGQIMVKPAKTILPNHFWLGFDQPVES
ncbi:MAG: hypothetical protein KC443_21580 [Anaerolineales bacterium]|nr:hypothetical protein [Anaerolineales bacterium]MCB8966026.1 hypothetical protein [Ardenticatenaceae bacterium]